MAHRMNRLSFLKGKNLLTWLAILGILLHIAFWFMLFPIAEAHVRRVWETMDTDPNYIPGREEWEPEWVAAVIVLQSPYCVYFPTVVAGIISLVLCRGDRMRSLFQAVGIALGFLTLIYALMIVLTPW